MDEPRNTILVVDDEESIRDIVARRLQDEGYDCETAADGKDALWKTFMRDFDLVLTDIKMPGMSGMEVLTQIANDHPDTSVVMITALAETQTAVQAMKMGASDYVTKPFNLDDLVMRVQRALERRRLLIENRQYQLQLKQKLEKQVGQIKQYSREAIEAVAREELALEELNVLRRESRKEESDNKEDVSSPIRGFARKLSNLIGGSVSDATDDEAVTAFSQEALVQEEPQVAAYWQQEQGTEELAALYEGTVELAILPPVSLYHVMRLHDYLADIPHLKVLNFGGSVDRGITIRLTLDKPTPLANIIRDLYGVKKASDESGESQKIVPSRKGEDPPVRRIAVKLPESPNTGFTNEKPGQAG